MEYRYNGRKSKYLFCISLNNVNICKKICRLVGFILSMLSGWLFYSQSKYYHGPFSALSKKWSSGFWLLPLLLASLCYYLEWGWAVGLLYFLVAVPLAYSLVVFLSNIRVLYARLLCFSLLILLGLDLFL